MPSITQPPNCFRPTGIGGSIRQDASPGAIDSTVLCVVPPAEWLAPPKV